MVIFSVGWHVGHRFCADLGAVEMMTLYVGQVPYRDGLLRGINIAVDGKEIAAGTRQEQQRAS